MHCLWRFQGLYTLLGKKLSSRILHINIRQLTFLQWDHQEVPAKFNFASDVVDRWAGMEKVMERRSSIGWPTSLIHPWIQ
jgi:medium-chain acyl-CoA synthetase